MEETLRTRHRDGRLVAVTARPTARCATDAHVTGLSGLPGLYGQLASLSPWYYSLPQRIMSPLL